MGADTGREKTSIKKVMGRVSHPGEQEDEVRAGKDPVGVSTQRLEAAAVTTEVTQWNQRGTVLGTDARTTG